MRERIVKVFDEEERVLERDIFSSIIVRQFTKPSVKDYGVYCIRDLEGKYQVMAIGLRPGRIGYGVGRRWKTIINLLEKFDKGLYDEVTRLMIQSLGKPWGDLTIRLAKGQVVGMACIKVVP